jgi:hypothetical protein
MAVRSSIRDIEREDTAKEDMQGWAACSSLGFKYFREFSFVCDINLGAAYGFFRRVSMWLT